MRVFFIQNFGAKNYKAEMFALLFVGAKILAKNVRIKCWWNSSLFLKLRTHVSWLKSTLLLKIKMLLNNYLYEIRMLTNKQDAALFGKGKAWVAGWGKESVGIN